MCYSVKTSVISYSLGMIAAISALATRQVVLGMLILSYCQMQLSELLIWKGIDTNNSNLNKLGTSFGKYLLASHNIAIGIGILLAIVFIKKKKLVWTNFLPLIIGILFFFFIVGFYYWPENYPSQTFPLDKSCTSRSCQNQGNRLKWPYPHEWYIVGFIISLSLCFIYVRPLSSSFTIASVFVITLIAVFIIKPNVTGSVWCFSAAILAPLIVGINYFLIRNKKSKDILT